DADVVDHVEFDDVAANLRVDDAGQCLCHCLHIGTSHPHVLSCPGHCFRAFKPTSSLSAPSPSPPPSCRGPPASAADRFDSASSSSSSLNRSLSSERTKSLMVTCPMAMASSAT